MDTLSLARTRLADSLAFQFWVGAADAAEALEHIFFFEEDPELLPDRFCGIYHGSNWKRDNQTLGNDQWLTSPEFIYHFSDVVQPGAATSAALTAISEAVDLIMADLEADPLLQAQSWEVGTDDPLRAPRGDKRDSTTLRVLVTGGLKE